MLTIDALSEHDLPLALRLSTQAGWNQLEADWRRMLTLWPRGCLAGRVQGELIATSTLATYGAALGWVGMVLVDEAHRGRGYGGKILDAALGAATEAGLRTIGLDATDLGRPVYLKRGFRDIGGIDRWVRSGKEGRGRLGGGVSQGCEYLAPADLEDALALDFAVTGVDRRALLTHLAAEIGVRGRVVRDAGRVSAFAFHRPGRTATHLGPVIADSEDAAASVLDALLNDFPDSGARPTLIDVPRARLERWLKERGFACSRRLTRMQIGSSSAELMQPGVFAACGFELG